VEKVKPKDEGVTYLPSGSNSMEVVDGYNVTEGGEVESFSLSLSFTKKPGKMVGD